MPASRAKAGPPARPARFLRALQILLLLLLASPLSAPAAERGADGRFDERRSSNFVLRQDVDIERRSGWEGSVRFERDVLAALEEAHDRLGDLLGLRTARPVQVWIYDPGVFDAQFAGLFRFPAAGFFHGAIRVRGDTRLSAGLLSTLHHEYLHAALADNTRLHEPPGWVNEGLAEWFENRALGKRRLSPEEWSRLAWASRAGAWIPEPELLRRSFAGLAPDAAGLAYLQAYARIDFLERRGGESALARFIDVLLRVGDVDQALARVYRLETAELDAALRAELG